MIDHKHPESPPAKKQRFEESSTEPSNLSHAPPHLSSTLPGLEPAPAPENEEDFTEDNLGMADKFTIGDKYDNFVSPHEIQRLREFKVLDEVKDNEEDSNDEDSDDSEGKCEEVNEEDIEKMLDEDLPPELKQARKPKEKLYVTRSKIVLEEKGINQFEVLPLDWMMVKHYSGMPVYMHRPTRVCTLSKPYFLGKGNTRRHDIPISAIPCYAYRRALEEEEKQKEIDRRVEEQIKNKSWLQAHGLNPQSNGTISNSVNKTDPRKDALLTSSGLSDSNADNSKSNPSKCPFSHLRKEAGGENKNNQTNAEKLNNGEVKVSIESEKKEENNEFGVKKEGESDNNKQINDKETGNDNYETNNEENENNDKEKANDNDENKMDDIPLNRQPVILPGGIIMPSPRVESVDTSWKTQHLTAEQINDYCKKLFIFKTVQFMHFNRWADRRKYTKARKALQYPKLPEGTKLITIPMPNNGQENGFASLLKVMETVGITIEYRAPTVGAPITPKRLVQLEKMKGVNKSRNTNVLKESYMVPESRINCKGVKRDWVINMNSCSYLSEFHEYVRRALNKRPVYEYRQLENASTPYQATVYIGGMQYGVGHGSSKRQAKYAAVKASIQILIPEMRQHVESSSTPASNTEADFAFFDHISIEDPRIAEFCVATCEPSPHAILLTCLLRNFGAGDWNVHTEMKKLEYQKIELTMRVGKHCATVVCKNKKTAKQRASQAILQLLHPHVKSWGSLLRLYGSRSVKSCKEKKLEEQQITLLQDKARHNEPNYAVLEKLRHEMSKLRERDEAVVPIGTLLFVEDLPSHSGSNLNNVDL